MAKDNSFDVVSQVDMQEIDNAVQQASREVLTRYDLKDSGSSITFERDVSTITVAAPSDFVSKQVIDIVNSKLVRREVDLKAIDWSAPETASGGTVKVVGSVDRRHRPGDRPQDQQGHQGQEDEGQGTDRGRQAPCLLSQERSAAGGHRVPQAAGLRHPSAVRELPLAWSRLRPRAAARRSSTS